MTLLVPPKCKYTCGHNIQLMTMEALDMMLYRPENTDIDLGYASVNIGILRSISHHVQLLHSQQLFYYIISLNTKKIRTLTSDSFKILTS